jgi:hypothetical protein
MRRNVAIDWAIVIRYPARMTQFSRLWKPLKLLAHGFGKFCLGKLAEALNLINNSIQVLGYQSVDMYIYFLLHLQNVMLD